ncbi:putative ferric-chelate reductase 1 isoform X1 [Pleurodeles waltl]|uniref:putative ferric-chelate reductase 1 isoform X1 n=1 Tax=Pleurodeles waltl TaxID=8319 RepID=UPI0037096B4F
MSRTLKAPRPFYVFYILRTSSPGSESVFLPCAQLESASATTSEQIKMFSGFIVFVCCTLHELALAYPNGQITESCSTMLPVHGGASANKGVAPFTVSASKNSYTPGDRITVTLQANSGSTFKGFLLQARTIVGDATVGTFSVADLTQGLTCNTVSNSAVSHKSSAKKTNVTADWVAPSGKGDVRFRVTFLQDYSTFWTRVESQTIQRTASVSATTAESTTSPTENQTAQVISVDLCGKQKTCFSNPTGCDPSTSATCIFMSITPASGGGFAFEMSGSPGGEYVAVGFSDDTLMGNDDIYGCVLTPSLNIDIQHVVSSGRSLSENLPLGNSVEYKTTSYTNGVIRCSFTSRNNISTQARAASQEAFYLFLGYGPLQSGNIGMHSKIPAISSGKVNILAFSTVDATSPSRLIHAHGALMLIAWMTTGSLGMICARYLKSAAKKPVLGKNLWFQAHMFLMVLSVIATIIAFILAFVSQMGWSGGAHPILGCIVMVLSFFQPILALFRPAPNAKRRAIFNWGHSLNALVIKVLAVAAIFLGLQLMDTSSTRWMDKVMGAFLGWEALIFIVLEINAHVKTEDPSEEPAKGVKTEIVFFLIYVFGNLAFLISLLVGIGASDFNSN